MAEIKFQENAEGKEFQGVSHDALRVVLPEALPAAERNSSALSNSLGEPLSIDEVAELIGCSVWTIRQRYLSAGLPHFRLGGIGKLIFYRNQIVRWILERQTKKGGDLR